MGFIDSLK